MVVEACVSCEGVRRAYRTGREEVWALRGVSFEAGVGRITALAGPSGSGKSTLLRVIAGLDLPEGGVVRVAGGDLTVMSTGQRRRFRARHLAFVFQDPAANLLSYLTMRQHLDLVGRVRGGPVDLAILDSLEIADLADELPATLSAGQQQRAALAIALAGSPSVILADEPTAELDAISSHLAIDALVRLRQLGATVVVASHDADVIEVADAVVRLERGVVVE